MKQTLKKTEYRNVIGHRVREARLKAKPAISQEDLAGKLAAHGIVIDRSAISRIESRTRYLMDYEVQALAFCLKVPIEWLFRK